jgi:hypothetical protein
MGVHYTRKLFSHPLFDPGKNDIAGVNICTATKEEKQKMPFSLISHGLLSVTKDALKAC